MLSQINTVIKIGELNSKQTKTPTQGLAFRFTTQVYYSPLLPVPD